MRRLDHLLVERGLAPTRSKAQELIAAGDVRVDGRVIHQASFKTAGVIEIAPESKILKYVSRGGLKLEAALAHAKLDVSGWCCLDVGLSTGGFADCLLQAGATEVAGFDVGHSQLHPSLQDKVRSWEGVNVRELDRHPEIVAFAARADLVVVDVSFISLEHVIPALAPHARRLLALVKPQFEVGADRLDKRGVVTDPKLYDEVRERVLRALANHGLTKEDYFACAVKGQDGNQEFFVHARRTSDPDRV